MQGQAKGSDFIKVLPCSTKKHNLELPIFVGIVTDGVPPMTGYKNGTVSSLQTYSRVRSSESSNTVSLHYPSTKPI